jgi:ring-1,2-phenylacetyl-CoA epoxidase subunit PaaE
MAILNLEIISKKVVATDAVLIELQEINNRQVSFEAGQFLTFLLKIQGRELRRSYSIAAAPGIDSSLAVVVKRQVNGEVSRYIIDHLEVGAIMESLPPAGRFTINIHEASGRTIYLIAAGSGISPVYALLRFMLYRQIDSRVVLIYQNRNEEATIFRSELEALKKEFSDRFELINLYSNPSADQLMSQRLNNSLLEQLILSRQGFDPALSLFYICGPRAFMRMAVFVLHLLHIPAKHIRQEEYIVDLFAPPPFMSDKSEKNLLIHWEGADYKLKIHYPDSILKTALDNNIRLPYSCRGGKCSSCIAKCISGKVKMSINQVLTEKDLGEGWVLTCVGYAETDVELEF